MIIESHEEWEYQEMGRLRELLEAERKQKHDLIEMLRQIGVEVWFWPDLSSYPVIHLAPGYIGLGANGD